DGGGGQKRGGRMGTAAQHGRLAPGLLVRRAGFVTPVTTRSPAHIPAARLPDWAHLVRTSMRAAAVRQLAVRMPRALHPSAPAKAVGRRQARADIVGCHAAGGHRGRGGGQRYDTAAAGMFAPEVLGPAVDRLAELAGGGRALEFAIGTGRVAIPLAQRGVPVTGIELSRPMI